ncbi:MAG: hypothetical protein ACNS64_08005 [Candidatus Halalkalibacterium sp. M3_1C_030]
MMTKSILSQFKISVIHMLLIAQETAAIESSMKYRTVRLNISGLLLMCLLFLFLQIEANAQINGLSKGDKVKITIKGKSHERYTGYVVEQSSFAILVLHNNTNRSIPLNSIERIYVKKGEKRRTGLGIGIGLVSGTIIGALHAERSPCTECLDFTGLDNIAKVSRGALIGTLTGVLIGTMFKGTRWQHIPFSQTLANRHKIFHDSLTLPSLNFQVPINDRY